MGFVHDYRGLGGRHESSTGQIPQADCSAPRVVSYFDNDLKHRHRQSTSVRFCPVQTVRGGVHRNFAQPEDSCIDVSNAEGGSGPRPTHPGPYLSVYSKATTVDQLQDEWGIEGKPSKPPSNFLSYLCDGRRRLVVPAVFRMPILRLKDDLSFSPAFSDASTVFHMS